MNLYSFQFEADFIASMRCIPMAVRCKLDTCLIKLRLEEWVRFTVAEKEKLFAMPCFTEAEIPEYRTYLQQLVEKHTGHLPAGLAPEKNDTSWLDLTKVPESFAEKALQYGVFVDLAKWQALTPLQRFALVKLGKPSHESKNFVPALVEFGLKNSGK